MSRTRRGPEILRVFVFSLMDRVRGAYPFPVDRYELYGDCFPLIPEMKRIKEWRTNPQTLGERNLAAIGYPATNVSFVSSVTGRFWVTYPAYVIGRDVLEIPDNYPHLAALASWVAAAKIFEKNGESKKFILHKLFEHHFYDRRRLARGWPEMFRLVGPVCPRLPFGKHVTPADYQSLAQALDDALTPAERDSITEIVATGLMLPEQKITAWVES